jgi:SAM-dependent methyltransferase
MTLLETIHKTCVHPRRVPILSAHISALVPDNASLLDVGCGDGLLAQCITDQRPDVFIHGIDTQIRKHVKIPVQSFDGEELPCDDDSYDIVLFVDVLHHTNDPMSMLRESARVARKAIVIKDHTLDGWMARPTLRFMDRLGNARYHVALPYNYWTRDEWQGAFTALGFKVDVWRSRLGLYPWPANWIFDRSLHFVARIIPSFMNCASPV